MVTCDLLRGADLLELILGLGPVMQLLLGAASVLHQDIKDLCVHLCQEELGVSATCSTPCARLALSESPCRAACTHLKPSRHCFICDGGDEHWRCSARQPLETLCLC